jgi:hypothetical protein
MVDNLLRIFVLAGIGTKKTEEVNGTLTPPANHGETETLSA